MKNKAYKYQLEAVRRIEHFNGRALLADEMGLGKTIEALLWIRRHPKRRPVIIVCPASLKWMWKSFVRRVLRVSCKILYGTTPLSLKKTYDFLIINYEILQYWVNDLKKLNPKILIIDECHYIKNHKAQRTKAVRTLKDIPYIIAISGTPLTNRPAELYNTIHLLRPDIFEAKLPFTIRYCNRKWTPWGWDISGASHLDELHTKLKSTMMIRRLKKDVLKELPDKIRHTIPLEIERKEYDEAVHNFVKWLSKISTAKAKRAAKAEQLVKMGYLKRLAAELKMKLVISWIDDFLEETEGKIVLFCFHRKIIDILYDNYKKTCVVIDGSVTGIDRKKAVRSFQKDKRIRIFIGNIKAAGVGITLTAASSLAFVEMDWVPGNHTQAEDRIHRIGQKNTANIYYLIAKDTIEAALCKVIQKKQKVLAATLDGKTKVNELNVFDSLLKEIQIRNRLSGKHLKGEQYE